MDVDIQMKRNVADSIPEGKFVVGNATLHDVRCDVEITPHWQYGTTSSGTMTYDVRYSIRPNLNCKVSYSKIFLKRDGKTYTKYSSGTAAVEIPPNRSLQ